MADVRAALIDWVAAQRFHLLALVSTWSAIDSWSLDTRGLARMHARLAGDFADLGSVTRIPGGERIGIDAAGRETTTPLGDILHVRRGKNDAALRVLLAIHMDTVYPPAVGHPDDAAQSAAVREMGQPAVRLEENGRILRGPGVADAKGGLAVMRMAIEAFERFGARDRLAWEVLVNADEEIGSPGSAAVLAEAARRNDLGLVFEPALDERGSLASARKGSGNFTIVVRGRAAHAGRHFSEGRSAVVAAAGLARAIDGLNAIGRDLTANVAALHGGEGFNVVPDLAILRVNLRAATADDAAWGERRLRELAAETGRAEGITAELHGGFHCPPKPLDPPTERLLSHVAACGRSLGLAIEWRPTGGACDGNKLAAAGLPTVDTLGVRGGGLHSPREYLVVESLVERATLTAILLCGLADGSLPWPRAASRAGG
jgi:glutamate carboxypeptidase